MVSSSRVFSLWRYSLLALVVIALSACGVKRSPSHSSPQGKGRGGDAVISQESQSYTPLAYNAKPEMRAVWLTTIYALDWPKTRGASPAVFRKQKEEFLQILTELKNANFNTIFLQVRMRGDLLYPSAIEPQSSVLTGSSSIVPSYDPLAFAIEECHKRGIALHAWIVTFPLGSRSHVASLGKKGVATKHPEWTINHQGEYYLNPGLPEVRQSLCHLVEDLVSRYDVDGVHFDYIRYPEKAGSFKDNQTYKRYALPGQTKAEWREKNINKLLQDISKAVVSIRPYTLISTAPIGRYREIPGRRYTGWTAKESVHQDPQTWFREGSVDFVVPMMYYRDELFDPYLRDWKEQMKGGTVIPGLGAYRTQDNSQWSPSVIEQQMQLAQREGLNGICFYRQENISHKKKELYDLIYHRFDFPVRPLPFNQRMLSIPSIPFFQSCEIIGDELILRWEPSDKKGNNYTYNLFFNLYDKKGHPSDDYLLAPSIYANEYRLPLHIFPKHGKVHFRVEAMNRVNQVGRASPPLVIDLKRKRFL